MFIALWETNSFIFWQFKFGLNGQKKGEGTICWGFSSPCLACFRSRCCPFKICLDRFLLNCVYHPQIFGHILGFSVKWRPFRTWTVDIQLTFDSAPVCLLRWNCKSRLCRCRNTLVAILRIECCATRAKTAFLNSLKPAAPARAIPSKDQ